MSLSIDNDCSRKSCTYSITSENQSKSKDTKELQKKKQIVSQKEGEYYSTYIVDEKGQKVLINKVPIDQMENQDGLQSLGESDETKSCSYNASKSSYEAFESKQQMNMEATHRKNLREVMDIIKGNIGIQRKPNKHYSY